MEESHWGLAEDPSSFRVHPGAHTWGAPVVLTEEGLHHTQEQDQQWGRSRADPVCPQPTGQTEIITSNGLVRLSSFF